MITFLKACLKTSAVVIASVAKQSLLLPINNSEIASSPEFILSAVEGAPRNDSGRPVCRRALRTKCRKALLAGVALSVLLTPAFARSAEREGTVLFFSLEDLQQVLSHLSLPSFSQLLPSFAWRERPEAAEQDGPLERSFRWGNGLGVDGYTRPGTRPLRANALQVL
jgi:hypothetical protein